MGSALDGVGILGDISFAKAATYNQDRKLRMTVLHQRNERAPSREVDISRRGGGENLA